MILPYSMAARPKRQIDIGIMRPFKGRTSRPWLRKVVTTALDLSMPGTPCQVDLFITDDETIKMLNREYRGLDEVTDVLAFSDSFHGHWEGEGEPPVAAEDVVQFGAPLNGLPHLGEIVISYPQAVRQSKPENSSLDNELALLIVHGILHLQGFDHLEPQEEANMFAKQQVILSSIV